jgi:hypothetical protein
MDVIDDPGREEVVKRATTPDERRRLAREARTLRILAHRGVVRLVGTEGDDPPEALLLERVVGKPLRHVDSESALVAIGVDAATTLADLHDIGWAHTAIRPDHVLVTDGCNSVLCGFGSCVRARPGSPQQRRDVADLAQLLLESLAPEASEHLRQQLRRSRDSRRGNARGLARMLAEDHGDPRRRRLGRAAAIVITIAAAVVTIHLDRGRQSPACPAADQGCRPVPELAGPDRLTTLYPKVVVMGRWRCTAQAYPAVLNLRTGAVWMFNDWPPPGGTETARLFDQVTGAVSLSVRPGASGCDRLVVVRRPSP